MDSRNNQNPMEMGTIRHSKPEAIEKSKEKSEETVGKKGF